MSQHPITTAVILAAGLGTRMRPLTQAVPKPLVQLKGQPLIDHVLDRVAAAGIKKAIINVHFKADLIERHVAQRSGLDITISDERGDLLDTGGGVKRALAMSDGGPILIHNSDTTWTEGMGNNLDRLLATWDDTIMDGLLLLALGADALGYDGRGDFQMATDGRLTRRGERTIAPFAFTGVSIAHPRLLSDTPDGAFSLNRVWDRAMEAGRLYGMRMDGKWMHVGTPEALRDAEAWLDHPFDD
ncbi:MAG: nucleotidyltransferase family protein [Pseudomonadota bacterium]